MNNKYSKAYTEVLEIIKHFSEEEYKKIPQEKIDFFEKNKDKDYNFKIDPNVDLAEQNISQNANAILVALFRDYFATDKQKETLNKLLQQNQDKMEIEKNQKYNPNNMFQNKEHKGEANSLKEEVALVKTKDQTMFRRILDFFKSIFKKYI